MPQLNEGGKYVFGLSAISNRREILFPAETLEQYPVQKEGRIIIFTGSKITGGFCVTSKQLLGQSKGSIIKVGVRSSPGPFIM